MRSSNLKKFVAGGVATILAVGIVPTGSIYAQEEQGKKSNVGADISNLNVNVDFYDYNIREYKGQTLDDDTKVALNAYQKELFVTEGSGITESQLFLFGGNRPESQGAHNVWTGSRKAQYQGIVKDSLTKEGNISFNDKNGIYGVNIFPQKGDDTLEKAGVVETYYNTDFKFKDEDGTYVFDSKEQAAYGLTKDASGNGHIKMDHENPGPLFSTGTGSDGNRRGFFPFNEATDDSTHTALSEQRHHMFGMKMQLDFFMPEHGKVGTKSDPDAENDMIFRFSGDDDVWVFVDGHLVLDLGGIHDTVSGTINFASGDVAYQKPTTKGVETSVKNIYESYDIDQSAYSEHNLTMFYLERGEYDSNCKITFNIPTLVTNEDISITKKTENVPDDQRMERYEFKLLYGDADDELDQTYTGVYRVYDGSQNFIGIRNATDGVIRLAADETAVISKRAIKMGQYYKVEEINRSSKYQTAWLTTGQVKGNANSGKGTETGVLVRNAENPSGSHIAFTNTYVNTANLMLKKMVEQNKDVTDGFHFIVKIGDKQHTVDLKNGESKFFEDIPVGTRYSITEVVTKGGIYVTPSAIIDGEATQVCGEEAQYTVTGMIEENVLDGTVTEVLYVNRILEATSTPELTTTPEPTLVTTTPENTITPEPTETTKVTTTPTTTITVSSTPGQTNRPKVTRTPGIPNVKYTPVPSPGNVTATPEATEMPKETTTPEVTMLPKETVVVSSPVVTELPEETPQIPNQPVPTELPKKTEQPAGTSAPKPSAVVVKTPAVADAPSGDTIVVTEAPADNTIVSDAPVQNIPQSTVIPNAPVQILEDNVVLKATVVPTIKKPQEVDASIKATTKPKKKVSATKKLVATEIPDNDKDMVLVPKRIPSELPQTGEVGARTNTEKKAYWLGVLPVGIVAGVTGFYIRRKKKNKKA